MLSLHERDSSSADRDKGQEDGSPADGGAVVTPSPSREGEGFTDTGKAQETDVTLVPDDTIAKVAGTKEYVESYYALTRINDQNDNNSLCGQDRENRAGVDAASGPSAAGPGATTTTTTTTTSHSGRRSASQSTAYDDDNKSGDRTPTNLDSPTAQYEAVMAAMAALKKSKSIQQIKSLIKKKTEQISEHLSPETPSSVLQRDITVTFKMGSDNVSLMESSLTSLPRTSAGMMEASITSLPRSASDLSTSSSTFAWSEFGSVCGWDPTGRGFLGSEVGDAEEEDIEDDDEEYVEIFDEGDIHWVWVSSTACPIKEEAEVRHWLAAEAGSNRSSSIFYHRQFTTGAWRNTVLTQLRARNKKELDPYRHYPLAIERVQSEFYFLL